MKESAAQLLGPFWRSCRRLRNRALNLADPPVLILAYHRVIRLTADPHRIAVTPEHFREQMRHLRAHCRFVRMDEDWHGQAPALAVTFDDGYADNLAEALPVLEEFEIPATFFISTGQLDSDREFWSDELERLVLGEGRRPEVFPLKDEEHGGCWPTADDGERLALHQRLHRLMLTVPAARREGWLDQLSAWAGGSRHGRATHRALTRLELLKLAASPLVTIGAHGVTHTPLALPDAVGQQRELSASKQTLEELLGREVAVFAYPFGGRGQYDATTRRLCREAGFRRAVTTLPGQVHRWSDPWQLPRQLVRDWDAATFAAKLEEFRA